MAKQSVEQIKAESRGLRGEIGTELIDENPYFSDASDKLLKFHGIYQQEDRDARKLDRNADHHQFMLRTRLPGGSLTASQYLLLDEIAERYANGTLRITTRQTIQFHGVIKGELRATVREINQSLITTLGACGDIVRNVMACPAPGADLRRRALEEYALSLTQAFFPRTTAYHQIWIDDQQVTDETEVDDPLYQKTYLPRKFKIAVADAGDNCVDIYTNDVGLVAIFDDQQQLIGFNLLAGGGMGMSHNNSATFPRLADEIAFITPAQAIEAVTGVVAIHRDYGDRENRKHARLKYILQDRGVDWFREELQKRVGFTLAPVRPLPPFAVHDHLGWHRQGDDIWYLGLHVENGRIDDRGHYRLRSGLRAVIEKFGLATRLTPQQNILLTGIAAADQAAVSELLKSYGITLVEEISPARRHAMACVALPTCGLSLAEAERVFPRVIDQLELSLDQLGIPTSEITARMTGCPNGCARPYVAEIAFVGRSQDRYLVLLGGSPNGTRLARPFLDLVPLNQLIEALHPVLAHYRDHRLSSEPFGDFVERVGFDQLRRIVPAEFKSAFTLSPAG
ncbi:MAG: Sulfite reductase [Acidobacteriota bacterium]